MKYRRKKAIVDAVQWFKNGDHPEDFVNDRPGYEGITLVTVPAAECKRLDWEGEVVKRYRKPDVRGDSFCPKCQETMHVHGNMERYGSSFPVCPGDFIVTFEDGARVVYPAATFHDVFEPLPDGAS